MSGVSLGVVRWLDRLDEAQRRHAWSAFPLAVLRKFSEDRASRQAALIAFFGFFSIFPLLLVAVTILSVFLDDPAAQRVILDSAIGDLPVIGEQIRENAGALRGSAVALASGAISAIWAGLAGVGAVQDAMNVVWGVRPEEALGRVRRITRGLTMLSALGILTFGAAAVTSFAGPGASPTRLVLTHGTTLLVDILLFLLAFKLLTAKEVSWTDVLPGAIVAGVAWVLLLATGAYLVQTRLRDASATYGLFALVIGALWWMLLSAQVLLAAAEINVVKRERLWPRSMFGAPKTEADHRRRESMGIPPADLPTADG